MTVMNLDKLEVWARAKDFVKEFPSGYAVREEPESYIFQNSEEHSTH